jgi:hypothetical protein
MVNIDYTVQERQYYLMGLVVVEVIEGRID